MSRASVAAAIAGALASLFAACDQIDPTLPREYACTPSAADAQCPGHWHCGPDQLCHNPASPSPYVCLTDQDCGAGWHCGVQGVCYDRSDAGAVPCRPDAGDCSAGWTCGFDSVCRSLSVGAPLPCRVDPDCGGGWRCGIDSVCLDARGDSLRAAPPGTVVFVQQISAADSGFAPPRSVVGSWSRGLGALAYTVDWYTPPAPELSVWDAGTGFAAPVGAVGIYGHVQGRPDLGVRKGGTNGNLVVAPWQTTGWALDGGIAAVLDHSSGRNPNEPIRGELTPALWTAVGFANEVTVAVGDTLWSGPFAGASTLIEPVTVPRNGTFIESIALTGARPDAGAGYLDGYAVGGGDVFELRSPGPGYWNSVTLRPPTSAAAVATWRDGSRGRVGYANGAVYSLPSQVQIGETIPGGALDFAAMCGIGFALSPTSTLPPFGRASVQQLVPNPDGGAVGVWQPVAIPADNLGLIALDGARLVAADDQLFLFAADGAAYRVVPLGGCP